MDTKKEALKAAWQKWSARMAQINFYAPEWSGEEVIRETERAILRREEDLDDVERRWPYPGR